MEFEQEMNAKEKVISNGDGNYPDVSLTHVKGYNFDWINFEWKDILQIQIEKLNFKWNTSNGTLQMEHFKWNME